MTGLICDPIRSGTVTPVCRRCGVRLSQSLSVEAYRADRLFWDDWICDVCNGGRALSMSQWRQQRAGGLDRPGWNRISELGRLL